MTGTTISQVITFLISPILSRIYTPDDFGVYSVFLSIVNILGVVITGRYELAILLPKEEKGAINVLALSVILSGIIGVVIFCIVLLFHPLILIVLKNKYIAFWLYLIPFIVMMLGVSQALVYWTTRQRDFNLLSNNKIVQSGSSAAINVLLGLLKFGSAGLIMGYIGGLMVALGLLVKNTFTNIRSRIIDISNIRMRCEGLTYINFPKFDLPNALFYVFSTNGIIILLTKLFGYHSIGFLAFTDKILLVPFSFFTVSFTQVFYERLVTAYNENQASFSLLLTNSIKKTALYLIIPYFLLIITSKYYVPLIFGQQWGELFIYIYILSPMTFLILISSQLTHVMKIINRQKISLILNICLFIVKVVTILLSFFSFKYDVQKTVLLYSSVSSLTIGININVVMKYAHAKSSSFIHLIYLLIFVVYILLFIRVL